jgi:hypothetical protein
VALASSSVVVRRRASDFIVVGAAALVTFAAVSALMPGPPPLNRLTAHLAQVSASFSHDGGSVELLEQRGRLARQLLANTVGPLPKNFRGWLHLTTALGGVLLLCTGGLRRWLPAGGIARTSLMLVVLVLSTVPAVLSILEPRLLLTGLLSASPLLVAALPAMVSSSVRGAPAGGGADRDGDLRLGERFIAIQCLLFLLLVLVSAANDGGNQCGPRYFLPAVPLAVWLAVSELGLGPRRSRLTRVRLGLAAVFVAAGILVQGIGVDNFFAMQDERARVFERLAALPGSDVLTSVWFVPQAGAPMALTEGNRFFFTPGSRVRGLAVQRLRNAGITSFGYVEMDRRGRAEMHWGNYWGRYLGTYYVQPSWLRLWDFRLAD